MASYLKSLSEYDSSQVPNAKEMSFGIIVADYNQDITHALLKAAYETLIEHSATENNIHVLHVPGAYELPLGAQVLIETKDLDAAICLGCVITGETKHDEYICQAVSAKVMDMNAEYQMPVVFGLLTPRNHQQALDRAGGKHGNKGVEAAVTAIKMVKIIKDLDAEVWEKNK